MNILLKKTIRLILKSIVYLLGGIALYVLTAILGTWITTGSKSTQTTIKFPITIYIISNGLHTDIVVPAKHVVIDWRKHLTQPRFKAFEQHSYISFGWGDAAFFLKSTQTGFPGTGTTLNAMFLPSSSLMHITFYSRMYTNADNVYALTVSEKQYQALAKFILASLVTNQYQQFRFVAQGYGVADFFFKAKGYYHLFNTCNNWTSRGLKAMDIRTGIWTPFEQGVLYYLK